MSDQNLLNTLKTLGYGNDVIRKIMAAAEAAEIESVQATRGVELTPMRAASRSERDGRILEQTCGMIRHLSAQCGKTYHLPLDRPVNLTELSAAISKADPQARVAVKANLHQLGLC